MVKIEINLTNRWLNTFFLIVGVLILGVGVYATSHPNPGHTANEIEGVCQSDGVTGCEFLGLYATVAWVEENFGSSPPNPPTAPTAPSNLRAPDLDSNGDLFWNDNSNDEVSFELQRDSVTIATLSTDTIFYLDFTALPNIQYIYGVRACNTAGCSSYSVTTVTWTGTDV